MSQFDKFLTVCVTCGNRTSKTFARQHGNQCKHCATGTIDPRRTCPDCGRENVLSDYQIKHHYHCTQCTIDTDPEGARREAMGEFDQPEY